MAPLVVGRARGRFLGHVRAQALDVGAPGHPRGLSNQVLLDQAPRRKNFARLFHRRAADEGAAVGQHGDDAVVRQALEHLADLRAADSEDLGQAFFA